MMAENTDLKDVAFVARSYSAPGVDGHQARVVYDKDFVKSFHRYPWPRQIVAVQFKKNGQFEAVPVIAVPKEGGLGVLIIPLNKEDETEESNEATLNNIKEALVKLKLAKKRESWKSGENGPQKVILPYPEQISTGENNESESTTGAVSREGLRVEGDQIVLAKATFSNDKHLESTFVQNKISIFQNAEKALEDFAKVLSEDLCRPRNYTPKETNVAPKRRLLEQETMCTNSNKKIKENLESSKIIEIQKQSNEELSENFKSFNSYTRVPKTFKCSNKKVKLNGRRTSYTGSRKSLNEKNNKTTTVSDRHEPVSHSSLDTKHALLAKVRIPKKKSLVSLKQSTAKHFTTVISGNSHDRTSVAKEDEQIANNETTSNFRQSPGGVLIKKSRRESSVETLTKEVSNNKGRWSRTTRNSTEKITEYVWVPGKSKRMSGKSKKSYRTQKSNVEYFSTGAQNCLTEEEHPLESALKPTIRPKTDSRTREAEISDNKINLEGIKDFIRRIFCGESSDIYDEISELPKDPDSSFDDRPTDETIREPSVNDSSSHDECLSLNTGQHFEKYNGELQEEPLVPSFKVGSSSPGRNVPIKSHNDTSVKTLTTYPTVRHRDCALVEAIPSFKMDSIIENRVGSPEIDKPNVEDNECVCCEVGSKNRLLADTASCIKTNRTIFSHRGPLFKAPPHVKKYLENQGYHVVVNSSSENISAYSSPQITHPVKKNETLPKVNVVPNATSYSQNKSSLGTVQSVGALTPNPQNRLSVGTASLKRTVLHQAGSLMDASPLLKTHEASQSNRAVSNIKMFTTENRPSVKETVLCQDGFIVDASPVLKTHEARGNCTVDNVESLATISRPLVSTATPVKRIKTILPQRHPLDSVKITAQIDDTLDVSPKDKSFTTRNSPNKSSLMKAPSILQAARSPQTGLLVYTASCKTNQHRDRPQPHMESDSKTSPKSRHLVSSVSPEENIPALPYENGAQIGAHGHPPIRIPSNSQNKSSSCLPRSLKGFASPQKPAPVTSNKKPQKTAMCHGGALKDITTSHGTHNANGSTVDNLSVRKTHVTNAPNNKSSLDSGPSVKTCTSTQNNSSDSTGSRSKIALFQDDSLVDVSLDLKTHEATASQGGHTVDITSTATKTCLSRRTRNKSSLEAKYSDKTCTGHQNSSSNSTGSRSKIALFQDDSLVDVLPDFKTHGATAPQGGHTVDITSTATTTCLARRPPNKSSLHPQYSNKTHSSSQSKPSLESWSQEKVDETVGSHCETSTRDNSIDVTSRVTRQSANSSHNKPSLAKTEENPLKYNGHARIKKSRSLKNLQLVLPKLRDQLIEEALIEEALIEELLMNNGSKQNRLSKKKAIKNSSEALSSGVASDGEERCTSRLEMGEIRSPDDIEYNNAKTKTMMHDSSSKIKSKTRMANRSIRKRQYRKLARGQFSKKKNSKNQSLPKHSVQADCPNEVEKCSKLVPARCPKRKRVRKWARGEISRRIRPSKSQKSIKMEVKPPSIESKILQRKLEHSLRSKCTFEKFLPDWEEKVTKFADLQVPSIDFESFVSKLNIQLEEDTSDSNDEEFRLHAETPSSPSDESKVPFSIKTEEMEADPSTSSDGFEMSDFSLRPVKQEPTQFYGEPCPQPIHSIKEEPEEIYESEDLVCYHCGFKTKQKYVLRHHIKISHTFERFVRDPNDTMYYSCHLCPFITKTSTFFVSHLSEWHGQLYECQDCDFETPDDTMYYDHAYAEHVERVVCPHCDLVTSGRLNLRIHVHCCHRNLQLQYCSKCSQGFCRREELDIHTKKHHPKFIKVTKCRKNI